MEHNPIRERKYRSALVVNLWRVPPKMTCIVAANNNAKNVWDDVKTMRMGDERIQETKAQELHKDFKTMASEDGESI